MEHRTSERHKYLIILSITLILTGYVGGHYYLLANYLLNNTIFFRVIVLGSLLIGSEITFYSNRRINIIKPTRIWQLCILMGIFAFFTIHFIYYIRPFTQYTSIFIYISSFIFGLFSGILTSQIYHLPGEKEKSEWKSNLIMVFLLTAGYWIPVIPNPNITIAICLLLFIIIGIIRFTNHGINPMSWKEIVTFEFPATGLIVVTILIYEPIVLFDVQERFEDKVVYSTDTDKHEVTITKWKDHYWVFHDGLKHISTIDDYLFYEPFILPVAGLIPELNNVLILGGENGCAAREVLKYEGIKSVTVIPYDSDFLRLCQSHPVLTELNNYAFVNGKVRVRHEDILEFITSSKEQFDLIILDLPDPRNIESNQFYTREFYGFCIDLIKPGGYIVTQSCSPYFTSEAFHSIDVTMQSAGFNTLPLHNQILTLGEWSWIIGSRSNVSANLESEIKNLMIGQIPTKWLNEEALLLIVSFGKEYKKVDSIGINTLENPLAYQYYIKGTWDLD